jgi:hypothetical protein
MYLRAGENSTISYIIPMVAGARGYEALSEVHLDTVTMTSSLNDIRLLSAESCRVSEGFMTLMFSSRTGGADTLRTAFTPSVERGATMDHCIVSPQADYVSH